MLSRHSQSNRQVLQLSSAWTNRLSYPFTQPLSMLCYSVVIALAALISPMQGQTVFAEANDDTKLLLSQARDVASSTEDDINLQHDWTEVDPTHYISNYPAPFPFSKKGEPEATLGVSLGSFSGSPPSLPEVVESEVNDLRTKLNIVEYLEKDGHKLENGIATYYEDIEGHRVGFIKYRFNGLFGKPSMLPQTVIHGITITKDKVWFVHLTVRFAGHEDEVRADQIRILKGIIRSDK
jgi:hypothetical protein